MVAEKKRAIDRGLSLVVIIAGVTVIIGLIGAFAVFGYIINVPDMYYYVEGVNAAIACHSAALFMVLGIRFICL